MCGRYSVAPEELSQIRIQFRVEASFELTPRYNVAPSWGPGHEAPIVTLGDAGRELGLARFWMIPGDWSRPLSQLPTAFNARSEDLSERRFWARSFESRRCLVPTTGYREFSRARGEAAAYHFHYDHGLFAFAGLWDEWRSPEGEPVRSFAIVTVEASDAVRPIHDRMPLSLFDEAAYAAWLDPRLPGPEALRATLDDAPPKLSSYRVSRYGNDSRHEGPRCIEPERRRQLDLF